MHLRLHLQELGEFGILLLLQLLVLGHDLLVLKKLFFVLLEVALKLLIVLFESEGLMSDLGRLFSEEFDFGVFGRELLLDGFDDLNVFVELLRELLNFLFLLLEEFDILLRLVLKLVHLRNFILEVLYNCELLFEILGKVVGADLHLKTN